MEFDYKYYIPVTNDDKDADETGYSDTIFDQHKIINKKINDELNVIRDDVNKANQALITSKFNPYITLKLKKLHCQLTNSHHEPFNTLWNDIHDNIVATISNILRDSQINQQYIQNITLSLSTFPDDLKQTVEILLAETKNYYAARNEDVNNNVVQLNTILVVIICVGKYKSASLKTLNGTFIDKQRLLQLFKTYYNYSIITNKNGFVTAQDVECILSTAKDQFVKNEYDGIMIFYSGYGNRHYLKLSDYKKNKDGQHDGIYPRIKMEQYFNGYLTQNKYKFFFIHSCDDHPQNAKITENEMKSKDDTLKDDALNRLNVMSIYSLNCSDYEAPFNKLTDDIDWNNCTGKMTGILMNSVFHGFVWNVLNGYKINFANIEDKIGEKVKSGIDIEKSGNLENSNKQKIMFGRSKLRNELNITHDCFGNPPNKLHKH